MKEENEPFEGLYSLPGFPLVLITVDRNIMTAAAFSFYSFTPPSVMVGIMPKNFTYELILEKLEFGINIPTHEQLEMTRICGSLSGRNADKYQRAGVTPKKGQVIGSYLITECPVNLECKVVHEIRYKGSHRWFIGEIVAAHVKEGYKRGEALMYWLEEFRGVGRILLSTRSKKDGAQGVKTRWN